jgi:uncharacterized protein YjiK
MNPLEYGDLIRTYDNIYISQLGLHNLLVITVDGNTNHVELYKNGRKIFDWIDTKVSDNKFIRYIGNSEYIFVDNSLKQVTKNL